LSHHSHVAISYFRFVHSCFDKPQASSQYWLKHYTVDNATLLWLWFQNLYQYVC
ncbi:hypothetical protein L9F63_000109, partial [Diploptera punctata]